MQPLHFIAICTQHYTIALLSDLRILLRYRNITSLFIRRGKMHYCLHCRVEIYGNGFISLYFYFFAHDDESHPGRVC